MNRSIPLCVLALGLVGALAISPSRGSAQSIRMNLFVSSTPLPAGVTGGGAAADDHCNLLGYAAGAGDVTWGAWLAVPSGGGAPVHPRERVGPGPWFNYRGTQVAESTDALVGGSSALTAETALTDKGSPADALPADALARGTPLPDGRVLCVALQIP